MIKNNIKPLQTKLRYNILHWYIKTLLVLLISTEIQLTIRKFKVENRTGLFFQKLDLKHKNK